MVPHHPYTSYVFAKVVGFDGSTTIQEFTSTLTDLIGCRSIEQSGFSIFSDDPLDPTIHHSLAPNEKVSYTGV